MGFDHLAKIFGNSGGENFGREIFAGQGCNMSGLLSQLSYGPVYEVFGDVNCLPATELDYRKRGAITEPLLLPAELQAHNYPIIIHILRENARAFSGFFLLRVQYC